MLEEEGEWWNHDKDSSISMCLLQQMIGLQYQMKCTDKTK